MTKQISWWSNFGKQLGGNQRRVQRPIKNEYVEKKEVSEAKTDTQIIKKKKKSEREDFVSEYHKTQTVAESGNFMGGFLRVGIHMAVAFFIIRLIATGGGGEFAGISSLTWIFLLIGWLIWREFF